MITSSLALLLTLAATTSTPDRYAEAVEVYACGFEAAHDINFDSWPDYWVRKSGPGYPKYLPVQIEPARESYQEGEVAGKEVRPLEPAEGEQYLRIGLDGGSASLSSPTIEISPQFSYVLEAKLLTKGLKGHAATISLSFVDDQGKSVQRFESPRQQQLSQWTRVILGPIEPQGESIRGVQIGLHLEPGASSDLFGEVLVDDVWLGRLPRMSLAANSRHNIFENTQAIEIRCNVSGIKDPEPVVTFELIDVFGQQLATAQQTLQGSVANFQPEAVAHRFHHDHTSSQQNIRSFSGSGVWNPPIEENGFYQVRVSMRGMSGVTHKRSIALAVIEGMRTSRQGEFGWSLPAGEQPLRFGPLAEVLESCGVNWVKYPVWRGEAEREWGNRFARFAEQLAAHDIQIVGLLDQPPESSRHLFKREDQAPLFAANTFREAELWGPLIDPVMTRSALNIRWWQIGADSDTSFVGYVDLDQKISEIKQHLERFGQEISLGISWRWLEASPRAQSIDSPPWDFISQTQATDTLTDDLHPAFTGQELLANLQDKQQTAAHRWSMLEPLSRREYSTETRALDLVQRMIAAKIGKADAVFIPNPFDPEHGLMRADGSPSELLLPWRTTSLTLAGTEYAGSIQMPQGSENRVFISEGDAVMVIWNETPQTETLYLGEEVKVVDLWGRVHEPQVLVDERGHKQQQIEVSRLPLFLVGVQPEIARWRMAFHFNQEALPSIFGRQLPVRYTFENTFSQGVGGRMRIGTPESWGARRGELGFKLSPGEKRTDELLALFGLDANSGPTPLQVDFEVTADREYHFSVYRSQQVGLGEVEIEITSQLDPQGNLLVEQVFTNHTADLVSFNCILFAPGRRRDRQPLIDLPHGKRKSLFILLRGEELIGKTLYLRAEEINGDRVLNYRFEPSR